MAEVGIRELKEKASQILREVREKGESYTITYQGKPCGLLVPYPGARGAKKGRRQGKEGKIVSLWGIWKDGPDISWEEFMEVKKAWTAHLDRLDNELVKSEKAGDSHSG